MKKLNLLILFLCLTTISFGQFKRLPGSQPTTGNSSEDYNPFSEGVDSTGNELNDSTNNGQLIFQNTDTINFRRVVREFDLNLERKEPIFSLDDVHEYQPVMQSKEPTYNLGNNGLAIVPLTYYPTYTSEVNMGFNGYNAYRIKDEDVKYYDAQRPYTKLLYVTGSERENRFAITHTQNWGRGLNIGANYERLVSNGFYENQAIDHNNVSAHIWFRTKNKKLNSLFHFISNKQNVGTNGGIEPGTSYYSNPDFNQRTSIPVQLETASKIFKGSTYQLQTSYDFGKTVTVEINDSISDTELVPRFRIQHKFNYRKGLDQFRSDILESNYFAQTYIPDTLANGSARATADTLYTSKLFNEFRLKWLGNKLGENDEFERQNFLADAYANISTYNIGMINDYSDDLVDVIVGGSFRSNPLDSATIIYKAEGEYHVVDYRQGDYYIRGEAGFDFDNVAGKLVGFVELSNQEQIYTANHFVQSHYLFDNDFDKVNARTIGGEYYNPTIDFTLKARYVNITNVLWYNNQRQPVVNSSADSYLLTQLNKTFKLNKFYLTANVFYQTTSDPPSLGLPKVMANGEVYYKGPLFKNKVFAKMGFNANWVDSFEFDDYDPSLDQFIAQGDVRYTNNAQIGFFTNFQLSRARVFFRLDNITAGLYDNPNYQGYLHPQHDLAFRTGINWVFVN